MSHELILAAINNIIPKDLHPDSIDNIKLSLDIITKEPNFPQKIQECAGIKLMEIHNTLNKDKATLKLEPIQEIKKPIKKKKFKKVNFNESDTDKLVQLMVKAEETGTLKFNFKGIVWKWNEDTGQWDYSN